VCQEQPRLTLNGHTTDYCGDCLAERLESWQTHSQVRGWESRIRAQYGLTIGEHAEMFAAQSGVCAICHDPARSSRSDGVGLVIDHDHETGEVRGLPCSRCNAALGLFADQSKWLRQAAAYLDNSEKQKRTREERRRKRAMTTDEHIARRRSEAEAKRQSER